MSEDLSVDIQDYTIEILNSNESLTINEFNEDRVVIADGSEKEIIVFGSSDYLEVVTEQKGDRGLQGVRGLRGFRGIEGIRGPAGPIGPQGNRGFRGAMGLGGGQGATGPIGPIGPPGEIDSELLQELADPIINEAIRVPIDEIRAEIEALPSSIRDDILGDVNYIGEEDVDSWFIGEEDGFIGNISLISMINESYYKSVKTTESLIASITGEGIDGAAFAAIRQEMEVIAEQTRVSAEAAITLVAEIDGRISTVEDIVNISVDEIEAIATQVSNFQVVFDDSLASITQDITSVADANTATTNSLNTYIANNGDVIALLSQEIDVVASNTTAAINAIDILSVNIIGLEGDIQELYEISGDSATGLLEANYQLKAQVQSDGTVVMAGIALGASIGGEDGARSEIIFMADTFAFMTKLEGQLHVPFIFDAINDTAYLRNVMIQDASITNAKIGGVIQSDNFSTTNKTGWRLHKDGTFLIYGSAAGTGWLQINNQNVKVYDNNNVLRVRMGYLLA